MLTAVEKGGKIKVKIGKDRFWDYCGRRALAAKGLAHAQ